MYTEFWLQSQKVRDHSPKSRPRRENKIKMHPVEIEWDSGGLNSYDSVERPVEGFCGHGNGLCDSIKGCAFFV
jgi:hypothetical protein